MTNVDAMANKLKALAVSSFWGAFSRVQCLLHILNLVVRVILAQFGVDDGGDKPENIEEMNKAMRELMEGLKLGMVEEDDKDVMEDSNEVKEIKDGVAEKDIEGALECGGLSDDERNGLRALLCPINVLLTKVSTTHRIRTCPTF